MPKRTKKEKEAPNIIVFLVEGPSDKIALELPLSNMLYDINPDYEVRFLLEERRVAPTGEELEDSDLDEGDYDETDEADEDEYEENPYNDGGDITSSSFVTPLNIEVKITNRFIRPAVRKEGIYPKKIAKIIQIVDLDGTFIPPQRVVPYSPERKGRQGPYYDGIDGLIETSNVESIIDRNQRKRSNIEYLTGLREIKIKTKRIPYEVYFFSSNLDHFINHDANVEGRKKKLADRFVRTYGLDTDSFASFFLDDSDSIGHMGYEESWMFIKGEARSVMRYTNIDCLIRKLKDSTHRDL